MQVVILCGGLGTRLREETEFRPKPMLEIGGRPILWHIMKTYSHYGFRDFILCLGYRGNIIKEYFLNYEAMNNDFTICLGSQKMKFHSQHEEQQFRVTLADTGAEAMTGARLRKAAKYITGDSFLLTYGDGVCDVNIADLVDFHQRHKRLATVTTVTPVSRFGVLDLTLEGRVKRFSEKPQMDGWVNAGYFVFQKEMLRYLDPGDDCILEREPLEALAKSEQLMAYRHDGFFYAMDTYREYQYLNELWQKSEAPWKVW